MAVSVKAEHDGVFANLNRFVVIPLFLFGGAFYPLSKLPTVVQWIARATPLWHGTTVARQFTFGAVNWLEVCGHLGYMVVWAVAGTVVATPEPDGPPSRNDDNTMVRPAPAGLPPIAANEKSMKNFRAPENSRNAP